MGKKFLNKPLKAEDLKRLLPVYFKENNNDKKYDTYSKEKLIETIKSLEKEKLQFIESSYDGYWDWYINDDYEYMSPRFLEIFGFSPQEKEAQTICLARLNSPRRFSDCPK